ncbi:MAG: hypothetical protein MUE46_14370 [Xanthomonadales bacterium]|jgi:SEC-C motif-containing protein|nr:hypothetical protein [Xanthomonadales bacterium]
MRCPCDSRKPYAACCGPLHHGLPAPNAERLMRSRYSAYVLCLLPYLRATWHPSTRPADLRLDPPNRRVWLGLKVQQHTQIDADHAIVAFSARSRVSGEVQRLDERSRFERVDGRWLYVDGDIGTPHSA